MRIIMSSKASLWLGSLMAIALLFTSRAAARALVETIPTDANDDAKSEANGADESKMPAGGFGPYGNKPYYGQGYGPYDGGRSYGGRGKGDGYDNEPYYKGGNGDDYDGGKGNNYGFGPYYRDGSRGNNNYGYGPNYDGGKGYFPGYGYNGYYYPDNFGKGGNYYNDRYGGNGDNYPSRSYNYGKASCKYGCGSAAAEAYNKAAEIDPRN